MENLIIFLVNWGMGAILIGVFALVCIAMVAIVYNLATGDKKAKNNQD